MTLKGAKLTTPAEVNAALDAGVAKIVAYEGGALAAKLRKCLVQANWMKDRLPDDAPPGMINFVSGIATFLGRLGDNPAIAMEAIASQGNQTKIAAITALQQEVWPRKGNKQLTTESSWGKIFAVLLALAAALRASKAGGAVPAQPKVST